MTLSEIRKRNEARNATQDVWQDLGWLMAEIERLQAILERSMHQARSANANSKHHCEASIACDAIYQRHKHILEPSDV